MATIKEIAEWAGVSRGTVDRVLNGRGNVREDVAQRVQEAARQLNYSPNKAAKNLAVHKKNLKFGFLLLDSAGKNPFIAQMLEGAAQACEELAEFGVSVMIRTTQIGCAQAQLRAVDELVSDGICGLVIMPENDDAVRERLLRLKEDGIAVVTVNTDLENCGRVAYVGSDYTAAGRTAAGLMAMATGGRAKIGIVSGSESIECHAKRIEGFRARVREAYGSLQIVQTVFNRDDDEESYTQTKQMLRQDPQIDALYLTAGGVHGACRAAIESGRQLRIICFDTVPTTRQMLQQGVIAAAIDQQPCVQSAQALQTLFACLAYDQQPQEYQYMKNEIRIAENL